MTLSAFTVTIMTLDDSPHNTLPLAPLEIRNRLANGTSGALASIFSDSAGANAITQTGATTDSLGQFLFYASPAPYNAVFDNNGTPVISAIDVGLTTVAFASAIDRLNPDTLAIAVADTTLLVGDELRVGERNAGLGGGFAATVVLLSSVTTSVGTPERGTVIPSDGAPTLAIVMNLSEEVTQLQLGLITGDSGESAANLLSLDDIRDQLIDNETMLVITSEFQDDIGIDGPFQFVRDSDGKSLKIHSNFGGGFVRTDVLADETFGQYVLSVGERATFVSRISLTGGLAIRFSAQAGGDGKFPNRRGRNTSSLYIGNLFDFDLDVFLTWGEKGLDGKSVFNGRGKVEFEWCHKGWNLKPLSAGSAGSACTSLYFNSNFDFTIFPFDLENVVYSEFTGFAEAIRQNQAHYEADETSIFLRDEGLGNVKFSYGLEAMEGMFRYNANTPSYITMRLRPELGSAAEDHFRVDGARISNIPLADQAYFSTVPVGTLTFEDMTLSGSTVVTSTGSTPMFHKPNAETRIQVNGGFVESGANYLIHSVASNWENVTTDASRFERGFLYPLATETDFTSGSGIHEIDLGTIAIAADGSFSVAAPAGYGRIISVNAYCIRGVHNTDNNITLTSKGTNQWDFITGLTTGFSVQATVTCLIN